MMKNMTEMKPTKIICNNCGSTSLFYPALVQPHTYGNNVADLDIDPDKAVCGDCGNTGAKEVDYFSRSGEVGTTLCELYDCMEMETPSNHEEILAYVTEYMKENADPDFWTEVDVVRGFRLWIQRSEITKPKNKLR